MKGRFSLWVVVLVVVMAGVLAACDGGRTETPSTTQAPAAADGATLLRERCTVCHTLERVESAHKSAEEWEQTVSRMIGRGARLTAEEKTVLLEYLATHYR
jgi:cytochrome c5